MKLEDSIEETAIRVCDEIAGAIERYASISGEYPDDLPESFIGSCVFANLGPVLTMTMETNAKKLWEWNANARGRWNKDPTAPLPDQPSDYKAKFQRKRADLVVYKGEHTRKEEMTFLCLVEVAKYWEKASDLEKIRDWFAYIDTCPYGICCGYALIEPSDAFPKLQAGAVEAGDKWLSGRIARPLGTDRNYHTFARLMTNPHYRGPASVMT